MTGSSSSYTSTSSKGVFTKSFGVIDYAQNILSKYDEILMQAFKDNAKAEQARVQKEANTRESGWKDISDKIKVAYDHEGRQFSYSIEGDESTQSHAMTLEYGDGTNPPDPLLRTSAIGSQHDMSTDINQTLRTGLSGGL
jgi:hypothetical protein